MFEDLDLGHDHPAMASTWTTLPNGWAKLRRDVDQGFGGRRATPSAVDARASLVGFTIGGRAGRGGSADLDVQVLSLAGLSVGRLPCYCDGFASSAACVLPRGATSHDAVPAVQSPRPQPRGPRRTRPSPSPYAPPLQTIPRSSSSVYPHSWATLASMGPPRSSPSWECEHECARPLAIDPMGHLADQPPTVAFQGCSHPPGLRHCQSSLTCLTPPALRLRLAAFTAVQARTAVVESSPPWSTTYSKPASPTEQR